ncbi:hypothetical protein HYPSUDRAFT_51434 [Hypholoma sublateritium FD-334 SS-4]|uniref:T4 RNA ligase 1-like N-terminal domain-containing protein n=1 Tax=Hypholoma sublateritium (strain FD-334 SS-4) TaxID=945553 RepID=A0A0D2PHI6_HYPSF|nr:hypothetical protein HYPSUDRAFT_51434 [Hypholoma sublateritium FD-334 SS-4]
MSTRTANPLTSLTIDPAMLKDYATYRPRPSGKPYALITTKDHPSLPLAIHNYTNRAFSRQNWDALAVAARALVTETSTGNVVSRSFSKFFNYHEKLAYRPTGNEYTFTIEEKLDGSIISLFFYQNTWVTASRSSFDSPHAAAARNILDTKYPRILERLDRNKTYIFELIDPTMPIKIVYETADLILLSIMSKDGKEPPADFDWLSLPFPRPRVHNAPRVNPAALSKLNIRNEEGYVVKFWRTANDEHPQRIKVKFESYLQDTGHRVITSMTKISIRSTSEPPSNASILATYLTQRTQIHHFRPSAISDKMEACRRAYSESLELIADDYGGESWLQRIGNIWDRIDALVSLQEEEWRKLTATLERQCYKPGSANSRSQVAKQGFERRIRRADIDPSYRHALLAWFSGAPPAQQVECFVKSLSIPNDLRSTIVLL